MKFLNLVICALSITFFLPSAFAARTDDVTAKKLYNALPIPAVVDSSGQMLVKASANIKCEVGVPSGMLGGWYVCEVKDGIFGGQEAQLVFSAIDSNTCKNNTPGFHVDVQMMIKCDRSLATGDVQCSSETHASGYEGKSRGFFCREY